MRQGYASGTAPRNRAGNAARSRSMRVPQPSHKRRRTLRARPPRMPYNGEVAPPGGPGTAAVHTGGRVADEREDSAAFERALMRGDRSGARAVLKGRVSESDAVAVTEAVVVPAMERIGYAWEEGSISLAALYLSGVLAEEVVNDVLPRAPVEEDGRAEIAIAVLEDHHVLGKRLVLSALRSAGYAIDDYGHGLSAAELLRRCRAASPRILLVSTLMLPSALRVREVANGLESFEARPALFVGGAPFRFDAELWREVGADGAGRNSADALQLVRGVL